MTAPRLVFAGFCSIPSHLYRLLLPIWIFCNLYPAPGFALDVYSLSPGDKYQDIMEQVRAEGLNAVKHDERSFVLTAPVFPKIFELQKTLLEFDRGGRLLQVSTRIFPRAGSDGNDMLALYGEVKELLVKKLGPPAWELHRGQVNSAAEIPRALRDGLLIRSMQWEGNRNIRVGIPKRVDGKIAIEVVFSQKRIPKNEVFWGGRQF